VRGYNDFISGDLIRFRDAFDDSLQAAIYGLLPVGGALHTALTPVNSGRTVFRAPA
jgi:hypothetical protein